MSDFTLTLEEVIETGFDLGLQDYPIHDESYRKQLNDKIIAHFALWEIGTETVEQFVTALNRKMNEVMPFYRDLYASANHAIDPFVTVDIVTTNRNAMTNKASDERSADTESDVAAESKSRAVTSETPQTLLSGQGDYATSATDSAGTSTTRTGGQSAERGTQSAEGTTEGEQRQRGYAGVPADLLMAYRSTILNIDLMVINELRDLFMGVFIPRHPIY